MAKAQKKRTKDSKKQHETGKEITTPSWFGSHKSMVVDTPDGFVLAAHECLCKDDQGLYVTELSRLDTGFADPNRYGNQRARL